MFEKYTMHITLTGKKRQSISFKSKLKQDKQKKLRFYKT
jgi:hypothetical protein